MDLRLGGATIDSSPTFFVLTKPYHAIISITGAKEASSTVVTK
jgi:hypothetical protein